MGGDGCPPEETGVVAKSSFATVAGRTPDDVMAAIERKMATRVSNDLEAWSANCPKYSPSPCC